MGSWLLRAGIQQDYTLQLAPICLGHLNASLSSRGSKSYRVASA